MHRVVKITGLVGDRIYFTKGDAHKTGLDKPVTIELIAGKVTEIRRKNLVMQLELPIWRHFNIIIAKLSFKYPRLLYFLSGYISLILEWKLFSFKIKNRLKKVNPILYNTEELLLILSRKDLDERLKNIAKELIKEGLDWKQFCESAMRSGVTILVYNALKTITPYVRIPQFVYDRLRSGCIYIVARSTYQHKELMDILRLFTKERIPVIPLKGTLLASCLYGDISARGINADLDLLIREQDKDVAKNILEKNCYQCGHTEDVQMWQWQNNFIKHKATMIDLHWDITMMCRNKDRISGLWQGARYVEKDNTEYYELKEEEFLLYLSAHLISSSGFGQLRYICDINELLHRYRDVLDWECLIKKAKSWKLSNSLFATLRLTKSLFNSDVPLEAIRKLKPKFLKLIFIKIFVNKKVILRNGLRKRLIAGFLSYIFLELMEAESPKEYLYIFKRVFFPPKEAIGNRSYVLRIFKGILKLFLNEIL